ncbi:MAG TPA: hypothetical protein PKE00_08115, partial [Planctomycetota bacterium]|nr:hypothetical protein [Planctomycetota bacterium]
MGYSRPRILNTVLDARDLFGQWSSTSAFEGLHNDDLTVAQIGAQAVTIDFNAYDTTRHSFGTAFGAWIATTPRSTPGTYAPRVAIDSFECLYVNEVFWKLQGALMSPAIFENGRSPHDFRLAPIVAVGGVLGPLNPLVNKGIDTSAGTLRFANYAAGLAPDIVDPPGLKGPGPQSQGNDLEYASMHAWDWDCEGFGNARIAPRSGFAAPPTNSTNIDIGADELGELIIAGYVDKTTTFTRLVPNHDAGGAILTTIPDHTGVYFFDLPGTYATPWHSGYAGGKLPTTGANFDYRWYRWAQIDPAYVTGSPAELYTNSMTIYNYTRDEVSNVRFGLIGSYPTGSVWEPFMRNLECDLAPALLPDPKLWAAHFSSGSDFSEFVANPWQHHMSPLYGSRDNHFLYYKPTHASLPTAVIDGTLNPPATYVWGGVSPTGGYIGAFPNVLMFGLGTYVTGASGMGFSTTIPESNWLGVRYNCEIKQSGNFGYSNLQSFL